MLHGGKSEDDLPGPAGCVVDVRDVAAAHVRAIQTPEAGGERFAPTIGQWTWQNVVDIVHDASWIPQEYKDKVPKGKRGDYGAKQNNLSGAKSERVLRVEYHSLKSAIESE